MKFFMKSAAIAFCISSAVACGPNGATNLNPTNVATLDATLNEDEAAPLGLAGVGDRLCRLNYAFLNKDATGSYSVASERRLTDGISRTGYGAGCLQFCSATLDELRKVNEPNGKYVFLKSCQFSEMTPPAPVLPTPMPTPHAGGAVPTPMPSIPPPPPVFSSATPASPTKPVVEGSSPASVAQPMPPPARPSVESSSPASSAQPMPRPTAPVKIVTYPGQKRVCEIEGGAGELLLASSLTREDCAGECQKRDQSNPQRRCEWGEEVLRAHPKNRCSIVGGAGRELYAQSTTRFICRMECQARNVSNPNRTCLWGAENVK